MYSAIDLIKKEIRLLDVSPGELHEPIKASLRHSLLGKSDRYEALSYTWGSPVHQASILVNEQPFHVNSNLHAALLQLRYTQQTRTLWIDAICINQADEAEKSLHIPTMHLVYEHASFTLVWLGRRSEDSDEAMAQLELPWESANVDHLITALHNSAQSKRRPRSYDIWRPLTNLFSRPWWSRVWVLQEIVCSSKTIGLCGSAHQPWERFLGMSAILLDIMEARASLHHGPRIVPDAIVRDAVKASFASEVHNYVRVRRENLFARLDVTLEKISRYRLATDPRDKVYGVLNLIPPSEWPCTPNYSLTTEELYTQVTIHVMRTSGDLRILARCSPMDWIWPESHLRPSQCNEKAASILDLPSWVPNWTYAALPPAFYGGIPYTRINQPHNGGTIPHQDGHFHLESDNVLMVKGVLLARVHDTTTTNVVMIRTNSFYDAFRMRGFQEFIKNHQKTPASDSCIDQINDEWELLTCNETPHHSSAYTKEEYTSWRRTGQPIPPMSFARVAGDALMARRVAALSNGALGLVPHAAEQGDHLAFIVGCHVPMVLRRLKETPPCKDKEGQATTSLDGSSGDEAGPFQVIGEAYLQGCDPTKIASLIQEGLQATIDIRLR